MENIQVGTDVFFDAFGYKGIGKIISQKNEKYLCKYLIHDFTDKSNVWIKSSYIKCQVNTKIFNGIYA